MNKMNLKNKSGAFSIAMKCVGMACIFMLCITCMTGCDKDDSGSKTGTLKYGSNTYTVSIGHIGKNDEVKTTVELLGNMDNAIKLINGQFKIVLGMKIVVDGKTLSYEGGEVSSEYLMFHFETTKNPDKILVYSEESGSPTLTFNGKNKSLIQ